VFNFNVQVLVSYTTPTGEATFANVVNEVGTASPTAATTNITLHMLQDHVHNLDHFEAFQQQPPPAHHQVSVKR
jgi:hypothetical protein